MKHLDDIAQANRVLLAALARAYGADPALAPYIVDRIMTDHGYEQQHSQSAQHIIHEIRRLVR